MSINNDAFATKLIIAQYNGDILVSCLSKDVPVGANAGVIEDSFTVAKSENTTNVKVFLWNSDMKPLWK